MIHNTWGTNYTGEDFCPCCGQLCRKTSYTVYYSDSPTKKDEPEEVFEDEGEFFLRPSSDGKPVTPVIKRAFKERVWRR